MQQLDVVRQEFENPEMMGGDPQTGTPLQDPHVPMPSPLRVLLYILLASAVTLATYACVEMAIMIYDLYTLIQWLGEITE